MKKEEFRDPAHAIAREPSEPPKERSRKKEFAPRPILERFTGLLDGLPEHALEPRTGEPFSDFAYDLPAYSSLISSELAEETTEMIVKYETVTQPLMEEKGIDEAQNAGDEKNAVGLLDPVESVVFSLHLERSFQHVLENFPRVKQRIQDVKGVNPPYIHMAEDKPSGDGNDHLMFRLVDLGGITDLMLYGEALFVKELAKKFIARSVRGNVLLAGGAKSEHLALLGRAGLNVKLVPASDAPAPFYSIEAPQHMGDIEKAIAYLENNHHPNHRDHQLRRTNGGDISRRIGEIDKRMTPFHLREGGKQYREQKMRYGKSIENVGEVAFYAVDGLGSLKSHLAKRGETLFHGGQTEPQEQALMRLELTVEAGAFVAETLAKTLAGAGVDVKEIECDWKGILKMIGLNNVYRENSVNPGILNPKVFQAVQETVRFLETSQFKEEVIDHLVTRFSLLAQRHKGKPQLNTDALVGAVSHTQFYGRVGFASCEYGDLSVQLTDDEAVRRSLITAGGRFMSHLSAFGRRIGETREELEQRVRGNVKTEADQRTLELLGDITKGGCVIVQHEVAERFGLEDGIPISVHSKGFPRPFDLVVLKSPKGKR